MEKLFAFARESGGAVGHHPLALRHSDFSAQVCFRRLAELALATLRNVQRDHMVT
jgi:hypothetical protein